MKVVSKSIELAGRTLTLEVGKYAAQATSAVYARYGDTSLLATVVMGAEALKKDYVPLQVDYQERLYAGGRIKGSRWVKREGRGTDAEILSGRLIDRSIRPLFPKSLRHEIQVIVTVLSVDMKNDADVLGIIAASAALALSPLPWAGPVGAVRVGLTPDDQLVVNPENGNRFGAKLDLVVTSTDKLIDMIEAGANQVPEDLVFKALETGFATNQDVIKLISDLASEISPARISIAPPQLNADLVTQIHASGQKMIDEYISSSSTKEGNSLTEIISSLSESVDVALKPQVPVIVEDLLYKTIRKNILTKSIRPDGRKLDEIRDLSIEVGVLPRVHGSAMFKRGQTQALVVTTLGAPSLSQSLESAEGEEQKRFMLHYNFPPFSTGETGKIGQPGRREIGHGALAERALAPVIPPESDFPYAIRVVSEIMSSNGSTSMASACGSTLSLMDTGVPILAPVAGISVGLVTPDDYPLSTKNYALLTDIIGLEDHHGDMDFKVAGTKTGVTAIQLDVKVPGLTLDICKDTLTQAKSARLQILEAMLAVLPQSRPQLSAYAPQISTTQIPPEKIGELIGPGGKVIKKLMADTETTIDVRDDGSVFVSGTNADGVKKALAWIAGIGKEIQVGEIYEGTVARIQPYGAFVNIAPNKDGLVHVSQMGRDFVSDPFQVVSEGQKIKVWVTDVDSQGKVGLSMIFDDQGRPESKARPEPSPRPSGHFSAPIPRRHSSDRRYR
ncbi:polyribonucleotide nucleotidyltransferase [Candidatus Amesbacteria bacterium RIFCSPHIGHO2_01_FULL_48_32]|uniref:Polyribonucleotide nucleotidyltransferase n=1 Tax=Candidatus Amesbacteria bacterium RIFCSPLOWO2_01_FULL_48_25 TaxID=1797259 RepID=A0A1F4ZA87_9BACT|nr:MAG: polyribonucleotide nucleotidyltransferase [Candidatus Amesbacteria bacterium RIFCSPHIGHO2_01_FULL_48_32]OGD03290.1 MAG: polyribonucleotide nucleotidyltransferase [Candidatus Amesbacteria bacterium RIFCSPLOWO2_01_FULL_48_25]HJZ05239.1 polyribonucleotide nucleotidyltransferase [Patescibacteria group bacterium]